MNDLPSSICGIAGEYLVAGELSRRGFIASLTIHNTNGVDVLATNQEFTRQVGIQVKTNQRGKRVWLLNRKIESIISENFFYIFVSLKNEDERPDFFIVPSKKVAEFAKDTHRLFLERRGRKGQSHNDSPMRKFRDEIGEYLERWDLLY